MTDLDKPGMVCARRRIGSFFVLRLSLGTTTPSMVRREGSIYIKTPLGQGEVTDAVEHGKRGDTMYSGHTQRPGSEPAVLRLKGDRSRRTGFCHPSRSQSSETRQTPPTAHMKLESLVRQKTPFSVAPH